MSHRLPLEELRKCGSVSLVPAPAHHEAAQHARAYYVWRPWMSVARELPKGFRVSLIASIDGAGNRLFRDGGDWKTYIQHAAVAGLAVLCELRRLTAAERNAYRGMFQVYRYVLEMQAHHDCRFSGRKSLEIRRGGRDEDEESDVLPMDLGVHSKRTNRWSLDELLKKGSEAALAAGIEKPTSSQIVSHGLFAAALLNPLRRNAGQLRKDVRCALFDPNKLAEKPDGRLASKVKTRLYRLIAQHLYDSQTKFDEWFLPSGGRNLPGALARRSNRSGAALTTEQVTGALLHLAWEAYDRVSECIGAFGQAFCASLDPPLSNKEQESFNLMLMPHRIFGGLPMVMIREHEEFFRPALFALRNKPKDRATIGALHRMLVWYSLMVGKRREADRLKMRRRRKSEVTGRQKLFDTEMIVGRAQAGTDRRRRTKASNTDWNE